MIVTFTSSFERSLKDSGNPAMIKEAARQLIVALTQRTKPEGLGLKKLRNDLWEIRLSRRLRLVFLMLSGEVRFILVGDHDDIRRYLKARF